MRHLAIAFLSLALIPHLVSVSSVSAQGHWMRQEVPIQNYLNDLDFVDRDHGWIVGFDGTLLHTADGGESWEVQQPGTSIYLAGVDFVDIHNGWIVGGSFDDSFVARTRDGGRTWTREMEEVLDPHSYPESVAFLDTLVGWVPADWKLFHTMDGGMSWVIQPSPPRTGWTQLMGVQFLDAQAGWVIGWPRGGVNQTYIARTMDGGNSWEDLAYKVGVGPFNGLFDLDFVDRECGWIVGDTGLIWHTEDGGDTWELQGTRPDYIFSKDWFYGVDFVNREEGWIVGLVPPWKEKKGIILHTRDGGRHWTEEMVEGGLETPGLVAVQFLDEDTGWCVGADGTVLRYVSDRPTSIDGTKHGEAPSTYVLWSNHPNPFNPETTIDYQVPKTSRVRISVHNVLGQKVRTLVDEEKEAGYHSAVWDGRNGWGGKAASGVYLCRMETAGYSAVRKLLLIR